MKKEDGYLHLDDDAVNRLVSKMPINENVGYLSDFFKVFGDSTRLKILYALREGEMCVYDLSRMVGISQSATSHQLKTLRDVRLVVGRREGKIIFYKLADHHISMIMDQGLEHILE